MNTPNPSKAQEWWHRKADELYFVDDYNDQDKFHEAVGELVRESQREILDKAKAIVERKYEKEAHLNKHCGDKPKHELCKDCLWGVNVMAEYHDILKRLSSLTNDDVEKKV